MIPTGPGTISTCYIIVLMLEVLLYLPHSAIKLATSEHGCTRSLRVSCAEVLFRGGVGGMFRMPAAEYVYVRPIKKV